MLNKIIQYSSQCSDTFKKFDNTDYVLLWKSKRLSDENIKPSATSDDSLAPELSYYGTKTRIKFTGNCLKQDKITYTHKKTISIYTVYELNFSDCNSNYPTLENCLFGAARLTKNADFD